MESSYYKTDFFKESDEIITRNRYNPKFGIIGEKPSMDIVEEENVQSRKKLYDYFETPVVWDGIFQPDDKLSSSPPSNSSLDYYKPRDIYQPKQVNRTNNSIQPNNSTRGEKQFTQYRQEKSDGPLNFNLTGFWNFNYAMPPTHPTQYGIPYNLHEGMTNPHRQHMMNDQLSAMSIPPPMGMPIPNYHPIRAMPTASQSNGDVLQQKSSINIIGSNKQQMRKKKQSQDPMMMNMSPSTTHKKKKGGGNSNHNNNNNNSKSSKRKRRKKKKKGKKRKNNNNN